MYLWNYCTWVLEYYKNFLSINICNFIYNITVDCYYLWHNITIHALHIIARTWSFNKKKLFKFCSFLYILPYFIFCAKCYNRIFQLKNNMYWITYSYSLAFFTISIWIVKSFYSFTIHMYRVRQPIILFEMQFEIIFN